MNEGYDSYRSTDLESRTNAASPYELVLVLFDGLLDELERVRGHLQARRFEQKGRSLEKCLSILAALESALDHEQGGELVAGLAQLYQYCRARLCDVSASLSTDVLDEVIFVLQELRQGWEGVNATR